MASVTQQRRSKSSKKTKGQASPAPRKQSITKQFRAKATARAKVLAPQVAEYHELIEFLDMTTPKPVAMPEVKAATPKPKAKKRATSRRRPATKTTGNRRGAPPRRAAEFTELVKNNPGMTVREASAKLEGINETYQHRIGKDLVADGTLRKEGSSYFIADTSQSVVVEVAPVEVPVMTPVEMPEVAGNEPF